MKKKLIVVIITLITVIVVAPYFIGSVAESQIHVQVNKIDSHPAYQIAVVNYDKGWFQSTAEIELTILVPEEISQIISLNNIKVTQEIKHGPILWQGDGLAFGMMDSEIDFQLTKAILTNLKRVEGLNQKVFSINSRTSFDLSTSINFDLSAFAIKEGLNMINVDRGDGNLTYAASGDIQGALNWQGLTVKTQDTPIFQLGEITIDTKQELVSGEVFSPTALFNGFFISKLSQLKFNGQTPAENFNLQDLQIKLTSDIKDDLANMAIIIDAKNLFALGQEFKNFRFDMTFESLDVESLKTLNQIAIDSQGQDPMLMAAKFQGVLPKLLEKNPVLKINQLGVETKNGQINSDLIINIDQTIYDTQNPMTMMLALVANAKGEAPEIFFNELGAGNAIESMVQQNFLVRELEKVKFDFNFNNGQALLNGKPMPLGGM